VVYVNQKTKGGIDMTAVDVLEAPVEMLEIEINKLEEPMILGEVIIEEMSIDCICGVY
jgi:hypothetical protein